MMKFQNIYQETEENIRLALKSLWTPGQHPFSEAIDDLLDKEKLLAEPVFQSTFGWEPTEDDSWKESLNSNVIQRLAIGNKYAPYKHQAESWKALAEGQSIVVTSGTGSGKTECFMYPVLSDLFQQGSTNAIEAIFLYPLNALMEDQKKRLNEYCQATGLHFAVYNGDTPEYNEDGRNEKLSNEIPTRDQIRDSKNEGTRPEILLTNPSMLEYILVRQKDQKMLQESSGKLRWIVIDEAHSYSGSSAVELSYQIKRILDAFGETAENVRFACTSATIGGEEGERSLAEFMATITGQPVDRIKVIGGKRLVPHIEKAKLEESLLKQDLPNIERVLSLRDKINIVSGMSLQQIWQWLLPEQSYNIRDALCLLDKLCELSIDDTHVLSLRAHFFMRSINGIYACANENCSHANSFIPQYGHLTTEKETVCPHCGAPLLELVQCKRCDSFVLMGTSDPQTKKIAQCEESNNNTDYFALDNDNGTIDDDELEESLNIGNGNTFFLIPYDKDKYFNPVSKAVASTLDIIHTSIQSSLEDVPDGSGKWVDLRKDHVHAYCPHCGQLAQGEHLNMQHFRIPISFINQTISPVFLKECASNGQIWGKYIAFTDSRQGTAISAKTFNIDVEATQVRERLVRKLAETSDSIDTSVLEGLDDDIKAIVLANMQKQPPKGMTLEKVKETIFDEQIFRHITSTEGQPEKRAYMAALMRHYIGRRPLFMKNMESMGLICIEYPKLKSLKLPTILSEYAERSGLRIEDRDWQDFLKITLDFLMRVQNHIQPLISGERRYVRESNISTPISGPDDIRENVKHWPSVKINEDGKVSRHQHRIIVLLCAGLNIHTIEELQLNARLIDGLMRAAWENLVINEIITEVKAIDTDGYNNALFYPDGRYVGCFYLNLAGDEENDTAKITKCTKAYLCPVTNSLLNTTFMGYSPLIAGELSDKLCRRFLCDKRSISVPVRPKKNEDVDAWMVECPEIQEFKNLGLWSNRLKYTYKYLPPYLAAEHSAQQSKTLLKRYTQEFTQPNPAINVLHCSTTMEMGVDIGDIDVVLMDTIPPTAANYLQRVGRAGRAKQSKAIAFSLCNNTAVGQQAFRNPMWALQTTNHMIKVRESQTIIQRHVNSFFFRQFICENGMGIQANMSVDEFMSSTCDVFIQFLDDMATNQAEKKKFQRAFGPDVRYTIEITRQTIIDIKNHYDSIIQELNDAFEQFSDDKRRQMAISSQIKKCKLTNLLGYLSENQFIPNANMPTGVATFDFTDNGQFEELNKLYLESDKLQAAIAAASTPADKMPLQSSLKNVRIRIDEIRRATSASRDIKTALNEYAPEQTVVVNEKNYTSAGIILFGAYNEETQTRAIYHCTHCGHTDYRHNRDENLACPKCGQSYRSIIDRDNSTYTLAYEPVGFRTDQNVDGSREEKTEKHFYDIRPVLLKTDWSHPVKVNMCDVISSGESGEILFYNAGNGHGFAFCKRCGRAAVEFAKRPSADNIPYAVRPGHQRLWKGDCEASQNDIARNVVFTGIHPTCYSVLKFKRSIDSPEYEYDEQLAFSLGVVIRRALAKIEGIDEGEIDFGVKQEIDSWVLFIYDVAKGGCGYSLRLADSILLQKVFDKALSDLEQADCDCHKSYGACPKCLVDRTNYRYTTKLSKAKALDWLNRQRSKATTIPLSVTTKCPDATIVYFSLKDILKNAIADDKTKEIVICASDITDDYAVTDWCSVLTEVGRNISRAVSKDIKLLINIEYHADLHQSATSKLPFVDIDSKFPDCKIELIRDMGQFKTALIIKTDLDIRHYFTDKDHVLSFSDNWGKGCSHVFVDSNLPKFEVQDCPKYEESPSVIVREGITQATHFQIKEYFSKAIVQSVLQPSDLAFLKDILYGKHVRVTFSDMYVNSALASLMLVYLIKEMRTLFGFSIDKVILQLDSPKRKCNNDHFNDYMFINMNFASKEDADDYTDTLFTDVLDIEPEHSKNDADHHRWLRIETAEDGLVEIRPDHGISGGFRSGSKYMNLNTLTGTVSVDRNNEDVLYYVIMKKGN